MSLTHALAWNTGVQLLGKIVSTLLGVVIIGLMTRLLGREGFGAYSTATAFLQVFALFLDLGLNVTIVAMLGEQAHDSAFQKRCVSALFTLRLVSGLALFGVLAPMTIWVFPYPLSVKIATFALLAAFFFPTLGQILIAVQQQKLKMHIAAVTEIVGRLVLLTGLIWASGTQANLFSIISFISLGALANFLLAYAWTRKDGAFVWNWDPSFWLIALKRAWPVGVSIAFGLIYFKADTLILSLVRSQAEVGVYGAAYRVLEILITVPFMYAGILLPILSKTWATKDIRTFSRWIARSIDIMALLVIPLIAGTWLLGERVLVMIAGKDFRASGDIMNILVLAVGIIYINTVFSHAIVAVQAQRRMIPVYVAVALLTLIGYLAFIPTYGMWAAAWLTVFSEAVVGLGSLWMTHRSAPVFWKPKTALIALLSATLMSGLVWLVRDQNLIIPLLVGVVSYAVFIVLFGGISKDILKELFLLNKKPSELPTTLD